MVDSEASEKAKRVETYFESQTIWENEQAALRDILKSFPLSEAIKWRFPTYSLGKTNLIGIGGFKSYFGLWFFEGAKLDDPHNVLINAQPGKTKMMRQWRMHHFDDINPEHIKAYIAETIDKAGT